MPHFVHLAPEPMAKRIRRNGIRPTHTRRPISGHDRFVYGFPVLDSFTLTYQWVRELRRRGQRTFAAVTFRLHDDEPVFVAGHYHDEPRPCTAAESVGFVRNLPDQRGAEILVPRRIASSEIVRIRLAPQGVGWRYDPNARADDRWPCDCPACLPRGSIKSQRYRARMPILERRWKERQASKQAAAATSVAGGSGRRP